MPPPSSQPQIVRTLRSLVWYNLDNNLLPSAIFIAERLLAQDPKSAEAHHLLAFCYHRSKQLKSAEHIASKALRHLGCAYIYAQCCLELGNGKEKHGIATLEKCKNQWAPQQSWNQHSDTQRKIVPDGAAVHTVIGRLYEALNQQKEAVEHYAAAVRANPFAWEAYERLCELGTAVRVNNIFKPTAEMLASLNVNQDNRPPPTHPYSHGISHQKTGSENMQDPFATTPIASHLPSVRDRLETAGPGNNFLSRLNEGHVSMEKIESSMVSNSTTSFSTNPEVSKTSQIPPRKTRATTADSTRRGLGNKVSKDLNHDSKRTMTAEQPARRSTRLLNTSSKITSRIAAGVERSGIGSTREREAKKAKAGIVSSRSRTQQVENAKHALATITDTTMADTNPSLPTASKQTTDSRLHEAYVYLLGLFKQLGSGVYYLCAYRCVEALNAFASLPPAHKETPWTFSKIGKVYFEMANYIDAEKAFTKVRRLDPTRTVDMEVFSTLLWHLRKEVELAHLAHELTELDRLSPQAWCAIGNSFSLQREHDSALKCFKRATQLDPSFAYAYTLQGHEHVSNEEYGKALSAYRAAISVERRHYNAWYGLGKVYDKQGKYPMAERHFRTAAQINPNNSVLICCIGMILEQIGELHGALEQYNLACNLTPNSALSRFKKARVLMQLRDYHGALTELRTLKDLAPDESRVHFYLGEIYKKLQDKPNAMKHYTIALNLDPKAQHLIKEAIETLDDEDQEISGL